MSLTAHCQPQSELRTHLTPCSYRTIVFVLNNNQGITFKTDDFRWLRPSNVSWRHSDDKNSKLKYDQICSGMVPSTKQQGCPTIRSTIPNSWKSLNSLVIFSKQVEHTLDQTGHFERTARTLIRPNTDQTEHHQFWKFQNMASPGWLCDRTVL